MKKATLKELVKVFPKGVEIPCEKRERVNVAIQTELDANNKLLGGISDNFEMPTWCRPCRCEDAVYMQPTYDKIVLSIIGSDTPENKVLYEFGKN